MRVVYAECMNHGYSGLYVTCIYCDLSVKIHTCKRCTVREDRGRICFAFVFACVVGKNPKTPNLSPMADNAITRGGIQCLGSPLYIYGNATAYLTCNSQTFYLLYYKILR